MRRRRRSKPELVVEGRPRLALTPEAEVAIVELLANLLVEGLLERPIRWHPGDPPAKTEGEDGFLSAPKDGAA
jgi:hypothetical protein